jgi:hypothetical protein
MSGEWGEHTNATHTLALLRARRERPRRRAAEQHDEFAPFQLTKLHSLPQPGFSQHNGLPRIKGLAAVRHFDQTDDRCGSIATQSVRRNEASRCAKNRHRIPTTSDD